MAYPWLIPYKISQKLNGDFSLARLRSFSPDEVKDLMTRDLHPFAKKMSGFFYSTVQRIASRYEGDASRI
jgi:hypothetical protein